MSEENSYLDRAKNMVEKSGHSNTEVRQEFFLKSIALSLIDISESLNKLTE